MNKHTFIINTSKYCSALLFLLFLTTSCSIDDDRSECPDGLRLTFKYKYAAQQRTATVDQLDLFAFDSNGVLCFHEIEYDTPINGTFKKRLWLNPGEYTLVAWTGLSEDDNYKTNEYVIGQTRFEEMQLMLSKINDKKVDYKPGLLLHGMAANHSIKLKQNEELVIPMVQDNNQVNVSIHRKGTKLSAKAGYERLELNITDNNSTYFFDNKIDESVSTFQYTPFYETREQDFISCNFFVLKLQDAVSQPILSITNPESGKVILEDNLISLIRKVNDIYGKQIDLERDTFFKVELVLDQADAVVSLAINGWVLVKQGASVG